MASHCLSEYRLDRHILGLENPVESEQSAQHIEQCKRCQHDLQEFHMLRTQSAQVPIPALSWWQEWGHGSYDWSKAFPKVLVVAAMLSLVATSTFLLTPALKQKLLGSDWGARGAPMVIVALQRSGKVRHAGSGETFYKGDRIRLIYRWSEKGYLFVIHRNRKKKLTSLYPERVNGYSIRTKQAGNQLLSGSLEVEGKADGSEEIWACFSKQPLQFHQVRRSIPTNFAPQLRWQPGPRQQCEHLVRFVMKRK